MIRRTQRNIVIISVLLFGIMLSIWQLKKGLHRYSALEHTPVEISLDNISPRDHLNNVRLTGRFMKEHIFTQPRSNHQHQPGYQVWIPFQTKNKTILISLGFQPEISIPNTEEVHGQIHYISDSPLKLKAYNFELASPYTVGQLDLKYFSQIMQHELEQYIVVLDNANDTSLAIPSIDQVLKHFNYATQFLVITLILCYYIWRGYGRK